MDNKDEHNNIPPLFPGEEKFWKNVKTPFKESKEDIWNKLSTQLEETSSTTSPAEPKLISFQHWGKVAATIALLIGCLGLFSRFYTVNVDCPNGTRLVYGLPDGSRVHLNSGSSLSFHPLWWSMDRSLNMEGEAFFDVKKGKKFTVNSPLGTTKVLGTSFNIFARKDSYKVFCKTGKVSVRFSSLSEQVLLNPNEQVSRKGNEIKKKNNLDESKITGWMVNKFNFTSMPLFDVIGELERQYDVSIKIEDEQMKNLKYTGYFEKTATLDSTLDLVCLSFDFTFKQENEKNFKIIRKLK